jgi:hypothetical protein
MLKSSPSFTPVPLQPVMDSTGNGAESTKVDESIVICPWTCCSDNKDPTDPFSKDGTPVRSVCCLFVVCFGVLPVCCCGTWFAARRFRKYEEATCWS